MTLIEAGLAFYPGFFKKKTQPSGFLGFYWVLLVFIGFFKNKLLCIPNYLYIIYILSISSIFSVNRMK